MKWLKYNFGECAVLRCTVISGLSNVMMAAIVIGCRIHQLNPVEPDASLAATSPDNGLNGQTTRCQVVYKGGSVMSFSGHRGFSCDKTRFAVENLARPLFLRGVYETSIEVFSQVLRARPTEDNIYAHKIVKYTPILLKNLMRHPQYPIHPAAFLATIKDLETGSNVYQWGRDDFRCRTPNMCSNKCFYDEDCERFCERGKQTIAEKQKCLKECSNSGVTCDDKCYGMFQVDPEIENLRLGSDVGSEHEYVLWPRSLIAWDYQKVCGDDGLGLIGLEGGPDYCALLFWLFVGEGGQKCTRFGRPADKYIEEVNGEEVTRHRNPCKDEGYTWTLHNVGRGPDAYQQHQSRQDAWIRKYMGFFDSNNKVVYGYEHCAVDGFLDYNPYEQSSTH